MGKTCWMTLEQIRASSLKMIVVVVAVVVVDAAAAAAGAGVVEHYLF